MSIECHREHLSGERVADSEDVTGSGLRSGVIPNKPRESCVTCLLEPPCV